MIRAAGLALLAGCATPPAEATWVVGTSYRWELFNHRLSRWVVDPLSPNVEVVGGASTTGFETDLGACYDPATCGEFPATDPIVASVDRVRARGAHLVTFSVDLVADRFGAADDVVLTLPRGASGPAFAWIAGWSLDTDTPHGAESCYEPRFGWLPDVLDLSVEAGEAAAGSVSVTVRAAFGSGLSREAVRACLDAAAPLAAARVTVWGVVVVGPDTPDVQAITQQATWSDTGQAQGLDDAGRIVANFPGRGAWAGWSSLSWRFHQVVDPGRGAYLRELTLAASPAAGRAYGFATNASPTALSGFDYAFAGALATWPAETFEAVP